MRQCWTERNRQVVLSEGENAAIGSGVNTAFVSGGKGVRFNSSVSSLLHLHLCLMPFWGQPAVAFAEAWMPVISSLFVRTGSAFISRVAEAAHPGPWPRRVVWWLCGELSVIARAILHSLAIAPGFGWKSTGLAWLEESILVDKPTGGRVHCVHEVRSELQVDPRRAPAGGEW